MRFNRSLILFVIGALLVIIGLLPRYAAVAKSETVIRAAIDIGSETVKLRVAEVDLKKRKIVKMLRSEVYTDEPILAVKKAKELAEKSGAKEVIAVGTAPFRLDPSLADKVFQDTGVKVTVLSQKEEGRTSFLAAWNASLLPKEKLVVWDIGGKTFQFTTSEDVFPGKVGSIAFEESTAKNPMSLEAMDLAVNRAKSLAKELPDVLKERLKNPSMYVVAVGPLFALDILPLLKKSAFTSEELEKAVYALQGAAPDRRMMNALLVLGFMEELKMRDVTIVDVNNADGALIQP